MELNLLKVKVSIYKIDVCLSKFFHSTVKTVQFGRLLNELEGQTRWNTKQFHRGRKLEKSQDTLLRKGVVDYDILHQRTHLENKQM